MVNIHKEALDSKKGNTRSKSLEARKKERAARTYHETQKFLDLMNEEQKKGTYDFESQIKSFAQLGEKVIQFNPGKKDEILQRTYDIIEEMNKKGKRKNKSFPGLLRAYAYLGQQGEVDNSINRQLVTMKEYLKTKGEMPLDMGEIKLHKTPKR